MHPVQEPHLENNGEDGLQGLGIKDIMVTWCKVGLRRVESLATPGLYFVVYYFKKS